MRYFVEDADYMTRPVIYNESKLVAYAIETFEECEGGDGYDFLEDYTPESLHDVDTALRFLNDRFSYDDEPFKEADLYKGGAL